MPTPLGAQPMSLEQFGQTIKAKHPEYGDMSDADVGNRVLAKYPQYKDMVAAPSPFVDTSHVAGAGPGGVPQLASQPKTPAMQSSLLAPSTYGKAISDTVSGLTKPLAHIPSQIASYPGFADPSKQGGPIQSIVNNPDKGAGIANALTQVGTGIALRGVGKAIPRVGSMLRSGGAMLDNAAIGTTADDMNYGANPGRAMATNRVIGSNAATLAPKLRSLIPGAVAEHRGIVASNPSNATINIGPLVTEPFDSQISAKTNPRTGVAAPSQISRAGLTRRLLTNVPDEVTGRSTPMMRDPNLTPLEATELKSNIYDMADYDNPSQSALSNKGLKGAAHNLKMAVEQVVPESIPSGQRLHDLMAAKDILEPQSRFVKLPTNKAGLIDRATTLGATTGAAGMDLAGEKLSDLSKYLNAPALYAIPAMRK